MLSISGKPKNGSPRNLWRNGTIDEKEEAILNGIAAWMDKNKEGVFDTRPWTVFGEGPVAELSTPLKAQGFNEGKHKAYTAEDIRFVTKGDVLYAHVLAWPENNKMIIKSLAENNPLYPQSIGDVSLLGTDTKVSFQRAAEGLIIDLPADVKPNDISFVLKIK